MCISRFRYRRVGGKDPLTVADDLFRGSLVQCIGSLESSIQTLNDLVHSHSTNVVLLQQTTLLVGNGGGQNQILIGASGSNIGGGISNPGICLIVVAVSQRIERACLEQRGRILGIQHIVCKLQRQIQFLAVRMYA